MEEGITLGVTSSELVLYAIGGLMALGSWIVKRVVNRIEKNYDAHLEDEKQSKKEIWIEIGNLRERVAKMEGKNDVQNN